LREMERTRANWSALPRAKLWNLAYPSR
jgi:hypothetical protein